MNDEHVRRRIAQRLGGERFGLGTTLYKFEKIKRAKREALAAQPGRELIDLGVGEPDEMADRRVRETLAREADRPENRGYTDNGIAEFRAAAAAYMARVYGVPALDPERELIHCIGAKSALSLLPAALVDPGDLVVMTTPGYPVFGTHARWYGGEVLELPLRPESRFLPDLDAVPAETWARAAAVVVNYPNNPTGAVASAEFFGRLIALARRHGFVIVHDAAYAALRFDGAPLSFLALPGAREVGVEVQSLSKAFNMTGWRIGFVAGNALLVSAFGSVKDNSDSGQFAAIQKAAMTALAHPEFTGEICAKYARRMEGLVATLRRCGFRAHMPAGGFFLYVPSPIAARGGEVAFDSAESAAQHLIREALVSTVPWDDAGAFLRLSVTFEAAGGAAAEQKVFAELERRLLGLGLVFGEG